jgi:alkylation response protein AidB-like acyl-CoA dehydrogenase
LHLFRRSGEEGFFKAHLRRDAGGRGLGTLAFCVVSEALARAGAGMIHNGHFQLIEMLAEYGNNFQHERYLKPLISGDAVGAMAITESKIGSSFRNMQTRLSPDGNGFVLNGEKVFINDAAAADFLGVLARSEQGYTMVILADETNGFRVTGQRDPIGLRSSPLNDIAFENCRMTHDEILGPVDGGLAVFLSAFNFSRLGNASAALGIACESFEKALDYVRHRRVGNHMAAEFQGLRWKLAELSTQLQAARLLRDHAAADADSAGKSRLLASQAKLFCVETAQQVVGDALQLTGRFGCLRDSRFNIYLRDTKALAIAGGTLEVMKNNIARALIGF